MLALVFLPVFVGQRVPLFGEVTHHAGEVRLPLHDTKQHHIAMPSPSRHRRYKDIKLRCNPSVRPSVCLSNAHRPILELATKVKVKVNVNLYSASS